jgi:hypothetical protein
MINSRSDYDNAFGEKEKSKKAFKVALWNKGVRDIYVLHENMAKKCEMTLPPLIDPFNSKHN